MSLIVRHELGGRWLRITIDRPAQRNALDHESWQALTDTILTNAGARVVSIEGGAHFCAGADVHELRAHIDDPQWMSDNHACVQRAQRVLFEAPIPTIAAIRGACYGGGVGLATACDLRIADDTARFAVTPIRLGLIYSPADTHRLVAAIGLAHASDMLLTSRELDADDALRMGLVQRRCAPANLEGQLSTLAQQLATGPSEALTNIKRTLRAVSAVATDPTLDDLAIAAFGGKEFAAGAAAFVTKQPADFG